MLVTHQPLHERPLNPTFFMVNPNQPRHPPIHLDGPASFIFDAGIPMVCSPDAPNEAEGSWNEHHLPVPTCAELTTAWIRTFCD